MIDYRDDDYHPEGLWPFLSAGLGLLVAGMMALIAWLCLGMPHVG